MSYLEKLNEILLEAINEGAFPGATYALVIDDYSYTDVLGKRSLFPEEENSLDTIYDMASLTKVVATTTAVLQLLEQGKFRLHTKVSTILPRFKHENLTIFDLMTHTSGLQEGLSKVTSIKSKEEALDKLFSYDLKYEPSKIISYSDLNYILLGLIVEAKSGMTLDQYVKENIFSKLEMKRTGFLPKSFADVSEIAPTEFRDDETYRGLVRGDVHDEASYIMGGVSGHAGLFSNAKDMVNFIKMILHRGTYINKILSEATVDKLFEVQVETHDDLIHNKERRGLGWIIQGKSTPAGDLVSIDDTIMHTGFTGTSLWMDRKNNVGLCILTNRVHPKRGNGLHMEYRARIANFVMAHLNELRKELKEHANN